MEGAAESIKAQDLPEQFRKPRYRREEASEYLRIVHGVLASPLSLAKYAFVGGGPAYRRFGRAVLYDREDLDTWTLRRLSAPAVAARDHEMVE